MFNNRCPVFFLFSISEVREKIIGQSFRRSAPRSNSWSLRKVLSYNLEVAFSSEAMTKRSLITQFHIHIQDGRTTKLYNLQRGYYIEGICSLPFVGGADLNFLVRFMSVAISYSSRHNLVIVTAPPMINFPPRSFLVMTSWTLRDIFTAVGDGGCEIWRVKKHPQGRAEKFVREGPNLRGGAGGIHRMRIFIKFILVIDPDRQGGD